MQRISNSFRCFLVEVCRGESACRGERPGVRKLRYLHSDESGLLTMSNLIVVLIMLTMTCYIGNVVFETKQKLEIQNAADSVTYSTTVWMARGMNAITTTNHLVGELTALCVIHEAIAGPEADHYDSWDYTKEHDTVSTVIEPLRFSAPITKLTPFAATYGTLKTHEADKKFVCYVTRVVSRNYFPYGPQKKQDRLVSGATIYDAKITLKKKTVQYLIAKSVANAGFYPPPFVGPWPVGVITAPLAYAAHLYLDYQLANVLREWHTLDLLGIFGRKIRAFKNPVEDNLIPMLCGYSHYVATGNTSLPTTLRSSQSLKSPPMQGAIRSTLEVLREKMGIEATTYPPPEKLFLPVRREILPSLQSGQSAQQIWGDSIPNNLSDEFTQKLKDKMDSMNSRDPRRKVRRERRKIVNRLDKENRAYNTSINEAKELNDTLNDDRKELEEKKDDDSNDPNLQDQEDELKETATDVESELGKAQTHQKDRDTAIDELYKLQIPHDLPQNSFDPTKLASDPELSGLANKLLPTNKNSNPLSSAAGSLHGCDGGAYSGSSGSLGPPSMASFMDAGKLRTERTSLAQDLVVAKRVLGQLKEAGDDENANENDPEQEESQLDKEIRQTEKRNPTEKEKLSESISRMEKQLQELDGQITEAENAPDYSQMIQSASGSNISFDNLGNVSNFDPEIEKYSQFMRATYPYVEGYRAGILRQFKKSMGFQDIFRLFSGDLSSLAGLKESNAATHFEKWTNRYALAKVHALRSGKDFRSNGTGHVSVPKLSFQKAKSRKPVFLYQMKTGYQKPSLDHFRNKGREKWTGLESNSRGQLIKSRNLAEDLFTIVGFAYRKPHKPFFYSALFDSPNTKGKLAFAQGMIYNGNAELPTPAGPPAEIQAAVGWDTLNWKDVPAGNSWKSNAPEFPSGTPASWNRNASSSGGKSMFQLFRLSRQPDHPADVTHVNWQAKLAPVTRRRLQQSATEPLNRPRFDGNYRELLKFVIRSENTQLINH